MEPLTGEVNSQKPIYLDHNASTPLSPIVVVAMREHMEPNFGNPSSDHWAANGAKIALENNRTKVAKLLNCGTDEIVFTSGGTEANNMAIKGIWFHPSRKGNHIITSAVEHDAIRTPLRFLRKLGARISIVPVDRYGQLDMDRLKHEICSDTALISVMHANNETGTIQPIAEIGMLARANGIAFHTDAAQSAGKIPVNVEKLNVDLLSIAAHKMYGPKGIGALYIRRGTKLEPHNHGAGHESGRRAGTESILLAAGLAAACEDVTPNRYRDVQVLRDYLWEGLRLRFGSKVHRNGHSLHCVPNTLNISFENQIGAEILAQLPDVAAATGSACHAGCVDMSAVLIAMGVPLHVGAGTIRFSLGLHNTRAEIDRVLFALENIPELMKSKISR